MFMSKKYPEEYVFPLEGTPDEESPEITDEMFLTAHKVPLDEAKQKFRNVIYPKMRGLYEDIELVDVY